jgi:hypothetical protein
LRNGARVAPRSVRNSVLVSPNTMPSCSSFAALSPRRAHAASSVFARRRFDEPFGSRITASTSNSRG